MREHNKNICNFTTIYNQVLKDRNISNEARGLFCYMMTNNPNTWEYTQYNLTLETGDSIDRIRREIKELENCGYLVKKRKRKNGQLKGTSYELIELPSNYIPDIKYTNSIICKEDDKSF